MAENILWILLAWGCAALFTGVGVYAGKRTEPMWFWTGTRVPSESVKDIPAYNRRNRTMWLIYSAPFWISGPAYFWFPVFAVVTLLVPCTLGIIWLVWYYKRIERTYVKK